jgi:hypothetical protein
MRKITKISAFCLTLFVKFDIIKNDIAFSHSLLCAECEKAQKTKGNSYESFDTQFGYGHENGRADQ